MRILLDKHTFYWWAFEQGRLSNTALALCSDPGNDVRLSIASVWELQIKNQLGKLALELPLEEVFRKQIEKNGLQVLTIELKSTRRSSRHLWREDSRPRDGKQAFFTGRCSASRWYAGFPTLLAVLGYVPLP